jgi:hypothetical protein
VGLEVDALGADAGLAGLGFFGVFGSGAMGGAFAAYDETIDSALWIVPRSVAGTPGGPHTVGEMVVDSSGVLYLCVAVGTPGTWIRVSHGGIRLLDSPQRAYDSRNTGGKFTSWETRNIAIAGVVLGVPSNALGMVGNLAVDQTEGAGFVIAYPAGTATPATSNINWFSANQIVANSATIRLGTAGMISLTASQRTHIIVDVAGYIL